MHGRLPYRHRNIIPMLQWSDPEGWLTGSDKQVDFTVSALSVTVLPARLKGESVSCMVHNSTMFPLWQPRQSRNWRRILIPRSKYIRTKCFWGTASACLQQAWLPRSCSWPGPMLAWESGSPLLFFLKVLCESKEKVQPDGQINPGPWIKIEATIRKQWEAGSS